MTFLFAVASRALQWSLLRAASLLAPTQLRAEWRREWRAELWHVRRERAFGGFSWAAERELAGFCMGAFKDALCLRQQPRSAEPHRSSVLGSPLSCLFALAAVLALGFFASLKLPGVRAKASQSRPRFNPGLILIQSARTANSSAASITADRFRAWNAHPQRFFDDMAFYRVSPESVTTGSVASMRLRVAHSSANLFSLLGVPLRFAATDAANSSLARVLILGCETFERNFAGNPQVLGSTLRIPGLGDLRVAGVAPCADFGLPGHVDAWLLEPDSAARSSVAGFVVARLSAAGRTEMSVQGTKIVVHDAAASDDEDDSAGEFIGTLIEKTADGPWRLYLFAVFLALLCLPAVTSVSMAESSFSSHRPSRQAQLYRAGFLTAKVALLLPIAWVVPLDMAWGPAAGGSSAPEYVQLIGTFCICLFGMRWVLLDQRRRCPVCLRRVTHPATVGSASRTFLDWNGTEMICTGGHTLLHVPGLPTSWFSTQRWLYLDNSWDFLFAASSDV